MPRKQNILGEELISVPRFEQKSGFSTTPERSRAMSRIKAKNSKAEVLLRKSLWAKGIRYRIHVKNMPGTPDLLLNRYRLAIFVDGRFWHGYQWQQRKEQIKSNAGFWIPKIERNLQRDRENQVKLENAGYTVMRFWDHQVIGALDSCINQIMLYLESAKEKPIPERL